MVPLVLVQSRLPSQTEALALQAIRGVRGNGRCADCGAQSESTFSRAVMSLLLLLLLL